MAFLSLGIQSRLPLRNSTTATLEEPMRSTDHVTTGKFLSHKEFRNEMEIEKVREDLFKQEIHILKRGQEATLSFFGGLVMKLGFTNEWAGVQ